MPIFRFDEHAMQYIERNQRAEAEREGEFNSSLRAVVNEALKTLKISNVCYDIHESDITSYIYLDGYVSQKDRDSIVEYVAKKLGKEIEKFRVVAFYPGT